MKIIGLCLLVVLLLAIGAKDQSLKKAHENFKRSIAQTTDALDQRDHALAEVELLKKERDQYAQAFLQALEAEAVCDAQYKATFEKRFAGH